MNQDSEFGYKTRQVLNQGIDSLDERVAVKLRLARRRALDGSKIRVSVLRLAGLGPDIGFSLTANLRNLLAAMALIVGATGTFYWNALEKIQESVEIDSALLADELPPSAYLDRGFQAWLERASDSPSQ